MKLSALIIAASAALAPMQAYASAGSDQSTVQPPQAQTQPQVAWGMKMARIVTASSTFASLSRR